MKTSNITFNSNVYILKSDNPVSDKQFMSKVFDPNAIQVMTKRYGITCLSPLQKKIEENSIPCAYGITRNGARDYTHGSINENGKYVCVNTCENTKCGFYSKCSSSDDYRKIIRNEKITEEDLPKASEDGSFSFSLDFGHSKVRKLKLKTMKDSAVRVEIDDIIRTLDEKYWRVHGFIRHNANGTKSRVTSHIRHHDDKNIINTTFRYVKRIKKYRFKDVSQLERFEKKLNDKKSAPTLEKTIETTLNAGLGTYQLKNITKIEDATTIIQSSIESKILINAGPGTGKTHTVIERLKYIALHMEEDVDPESVLILCFSRSAVKVIKERLEEAMEKHEIPYIARNFTISTFDSFATWYLMQIDPEMDLSSESYDERIEHFIRKYNYDHSILNDSLSYLIVDEIQDLVGVRAKLVQTLLANITCGFLLLGDECQAIYDYQISSPDELNAVKLYEWLETFFKESIKEYELTHNWRSTGKIESGLKILRNAMLKLPFQIQNGELKNVFKQYEIRDLGVEEMLQCCNDGSGDTRAILSWSNGEAYRQSQELYTRSDLKISHTILSGSRRVIFRRELADVFCDYDRVYISKDLFMVRCDKKNISKNNADKIWAGILHTLDKEDNGSEIRLADLKKELILEKRISEDLTAEEKTDITISTIHKSKGKEYDMVILKQVGDISSEEDIKVYYVGLTRAKKDLVVVRKRNSAKDIRTNSGRFVELTKGYNAKIKRVELGIDGDIDPIGFVDKNLSGLNVEERQRYISNEVHRGDPIKISKSHGSYLLTHNGYIIGKINNSAFEEFRRYYQSGKYYTYSFESYTDFDELYVRDVVAIVNKRLDTRIDEKYKESGFWYGIEFCGYAKPREE